MQANAIPVRDEYVKLGGKGEADGYDFGCDLISLNDPPTAVFSCNNKMMAGLLRACGEAGVRCPEDLSIAGFDDHIWMRAYNPPLTVVAQDAYRIGRESTVSLLKLIAEPDNKQPADPIWLPCQVMVRSSTGAPRAKKLQLSKKFSKRFDSS
jgi:LacI family transcriptional regulator